jgi:Cys-rich repeat protein
MSRAVLALCAAFAVVALVAACTVTTLQRKRVGEICTSTRADCAYGLECRVPLAAEPKATAVDGGSLPADAGPALQADVAQPDGGPTKRCEYLFYAECGEEAGGPQCLSGQKCREGHCTVQCAADAECGEGSICKIGVCQRRRAALTQCYDNRDCTWPDTCFHGQCVTRTDAYRCATDLDCGVGYRCVNGRCQ